MYKIDRRDFLKITAVGGAGLLMSHALPRQGNAQKDATFQECEKVVVTVVTDNLADATRPHYKIARRHMAVSPLEWGLHAEHGLAYHVETTVAGTPHQFLFDFGSDIHGVKRNYQLLNVDFTRIEALAVSHDHFDHQAALVELLKDKGKELPSGVPLYVGEKFFVGTYWKTSGGKVISLLALKREDIETLKFVKLVESPTTPSEMVPGAFLTGRVERVTEYERIDSGFVAKAGDQLVQEDFPGEQAVFINLKGKGLVVLSGCAHRGIVNTVLHAQKISGVRKVHAIIGGFHLTGANPEVIQKTIADIKIIKPDYIVPTHCTGFEAITEFSRAMPDQFILNTAGTRYIMTM